MTDTIVIRQVRRQGFTTLSNAPLRDPSLSWKAKGLLANLFSHAEGFPLRLSVLVRQSADGRHATNSASMELQRAGYLTVTRERDRKGRFVRTVWEIREEPAEPQEPRAHRKTVPRPPHPQSDFQAVDGAHNPGFQVVESRGHTEEQNYSEIPPSGEALTVPRSLSTNDVASALKLVRSFGLEVGQQLLDELAAKLEANLVRGAPLAYLKALAGRAANGSFTPSAGLAVAARRRQMAIAEESARERRRDTIELAERVVAQRQDPEAMQRTEAAMDECRNMLRLQSRARLDGNANTIEAESRAGSLRIPQG